MLAVLEQETPIGDEILNKNSTANLVDPPSKQPDLDDDEMVSINALFKEQQNPTPNL